MCNDDDIIRANVRETKLKSPDYKEVPEDMAVADFLARIQHYLSVYQPLGSDDTEDDLAYIKLIDVGKQIIANRIHGFLNSRIMFFLSNLHITPRPIWLTRHGESEYNVQGRIGGDSMLSPRGQAYALRLAAFMNKLYPPGAAGSELVVWTSTLRRTMLTAAPLAREIVTWKALDEIDAGICDGLTYEAIAATMPEEYAARAKNKVRRHAGATVRERKGREGGPHPQAYGQTAAAAQPPRPRPPPHPPPPTSSPTATPGASRTRTSSTAWSPSSSSSCGRRRPSSSCPTKRPSASCTRT